MGANLELVRIHHLITFLLVLHQDLCLDMFPHAYTHNPNQFGFTLILIHRKIFHSSTVYNNWNKLKNIRKCNKTRIFCLKFSHITTLALCYIMFKTLLLINMEIKIFDLNLLRCMHYFSCIECTDFVLHRCYMWYKVKDFTLWCEFFIQTKRSVHQDIY